MSAGVPTSLISVAKEGNKYLRGSGAYERLLDFFKRKNAYPVIFFGASGAGKTALLRSLAGLPAMVDRENRTDEVKEAKHRLEEQFIEIIDTPGEIEHKSKRDDLIIEVGRRRSVGIINVVSCGYHEGRGRAAEVIEGESVSNSFLDQRRKIEIDLLREWTGPICGRNGSVKWILTVVSKADLWWRPMREQDAILYYHSPAYKAAFDLTDNTAHSIMPFSSLNQMFYGLAPMSGYYTDAMRGKHTESVVNYILEKVGQHG